MSIDDEQAFQEIKSFLSSSRSAEAAEYAAKGRAHKLLSDGELETRWIASFNSATLDPSNAELRNLARSLQMEFVLRGQDPPIMKVLSAAQRQAQEIIAALKGLKGKPLKKLNNGLAAEMKVDRERRSPKKTN